MQTSGAVNLSPVEGRRMERFRGGQRSQRAWMPVRNSPRFWACGLTAHQQSFRREKDAWAVQKELRLHDFPLEQMLQEQQGDLTFAFIDVSSQHLDSFTAPAEFWQSLESLA